jgi:hypothetical protein
MLSRTFCVLVVSLAAGNAMAARMQAGPIQKVIQLLGDIQMKRIKEGEAEQSNFEKFSRWCEKTAIEKQNTISDFKEQITSLKASADTATSNIEQLDAMIEELSSGISTNEEQSKEASALRAKEHADFLKRDADLGATVDMLARAHMVLKKNLNSANAAFIQTSLEKVMGTLKSIVDASFVNLEDRQVIEALIQQSSSEDDSSLDQISESFNKPYESKSGVILDTISGMKEKAEVTRNEEQKQEMKAQHAFEMLDSSLQDEIASLKKQLDDSKKKKNRNAETKATSEGELEAVTKDLGGDEKYLADLQRECMEKADEFSQAQTERAAELKVLAEAKKILAAAGKGAALVQASPSNDLFVGPSFLQTRMATRTRTESQMQREYQTRAADYLMQEGDRIGSWVLAQVGSHIQADPFGKVKQMIQEMVEKLLEEQAEEAEHKTWCDAELTKTKKSLASKQTKMEDISTKIEKAQAMSAKLEEQVKALAGELADMDTQDQQATAMRQKEHEEFGSQKADLTAAQEATATAIKVLKSYYSGKSFIQTADTSMTAMSSLMQERSGSDQPAGGAASSVIGLLEVAESDFSKALAEGQASEDAAQQEYDEMIQDNRVSRGEKTADQKAKVAEKGRLDNLVSETKLDSKDAGDELSAVMEYFDKLKGSCETKAPSFEERQARRKQEMEGLQNALAILEGKAIALLETGGSGMDLGPMPSAASLLRR